MLVQQEIKNQEEEARVVKAVEMGNQGKWTKWETEQRELTWSDIWKYTAFQLQFLLRAVCDVLPTPTNLKTWGLTEDPMCTLCQKPANLEHILSSCQVALTQGRYTWRHNQVLRALAHTLETERKKDHVQTEHQRFISFVRSGEQTTGTKPQHRKGILNMARDWELRVDLEKKLVFPPIVETTQRPDILLISEQTKKLVVIELTVPWETRCQEAHERK